MTEKLLPCPFCGGIAEITDHRTMWSVACVDCYATVIGERAPEPDGTEKDEYWEQIEQTAIIKWNHRMTDKAEA